MNDYKNKVFDNICYTELVYGRINKKLKLEHSNIDIEELILSTIKETPSDSFITIGKNIYITNNKRNIRLTINSNTNRLITADIIK